nr:reverse transcriptase domain-containing protein [Tanacetum cinerariifolium]
MADQRTMAQLLQAPTEGYEDAIVVPAITADYFELKHGLLTLVQNKKFFGHDKEDPHAHTRYFNKITSTLKFRNVLNTSIKLMLFSFFLEGAARIWLEKEPSRSIFTWDDLVSKFINQFFPLSKTTNLRNEITNFQQCFDESFSEVWDIFKDLLRACHHHGFLKLHQLDTFYNALNSKDQDSLNSAVGGNFLNKMPRECLAIIESKSKVCYSCNKLVVAKVSINTSTSGISPDVAELNDMVKALFLDKKGQNQAPATLKAVKESCFVNTNSSSTSSLGTLPSNNIAIPRSDLKAITTRSGVSCNGPQIPPPPSFLPKVVENKPEATKDTVHPTNNGSTEDVQPSVVRTQSPILNSEPVNCLIIDLVASAVSASKPNLRPSIPYPSRLQDQRLRDKANDQHFDADPRVPLIIRRSFLKTGKALIDLFEGELTLRVGKEAVTFNLDQTSRYSANYNDMTAKQIDVIDMACEEFSQEVLEVHAFLALDDDPTSPKVDQSYLDSEGDILLLEAFLNDDPSLPPLNQVNYLPEVRKELKICEAKCDKSSIDKPPEVELKDLPPYLKYAFLEGDDKLPVIIAKYLSVEEKTALIMVLKSHKGLRTSDPTSEKSKSQNPRCDQTRDQEKTTFTCPYGMFSYRRMPFGLCNAPGTFQSDFSIGVVLGQRQEKHFRPIHYASKTMTKAESNYTKTEKEMLVVVYAFEKFRSYLIMNKRIVYADHFALKYLFAKKDSKANLLFWVLHLQEFTFKVIDIKGAENLAADHLS